jgi:hypothetical protein
MKKLIVCLMAMAFAVAVQAGEGKACKDKAACADKAKAQAKAECGDKAACCSGAKATVAKKVLMSPKAMSLASN